VDAALKAIAEPRRRAILRLVWDAELAAGEIATHFDISRPAVSQHLRVLKDADLVNERRDGTRRLYLAKRDTVAELRRFLDEYWTDTLTRLRDVAEDVERDQRQRTEPTTERDA
jgi:DNA-binding transcriptional ArsR family regulator